MEFLIFSALKYGTEDIHLSTHSSAKNIAIYSYYLFFLSGHTVYSLHLNNILQFTYKYLNTRIFK